MDTQKPESWQQKFYKLAELYLESESLVKFSCNKLLKARPVLQCTFFEELTGEQQEAYGEEPRKHVGDIINGTFGVVPAVPSKISETRKRLDKLREERRKKFAKPIRPRIEGIIV